MKYNRTYFIFSLLFPFMVLAKDVEPGLNANIKKENKFN